MATMDRASVFLDEVLGPTGAAAIRKAASRCAGLEGVLVPRAILAWLRAQDAVGAFQSREPSSGPLVGIESVRYSFVKKEDGWFGHVLQKGKTEAYNFSRQHIFHVAAAVAMALGVELSEPPTASDADLERLGKSMDLLAKARVVQLALEKSKKDWKKCELCKAMIKPWEKSHACKDKVLDKAAIGGAGGAAAPQGPKAPQAGQDAGMKGAGAGTAAGAGGKTAPKSAKKPPSLRVMKAESGRGCKVCGTAHFTVDKFTGCSCFKGLAKSVKVTSLGDQLHLEFGDGWDREAVITLAETFN